jgi:MFS family permease
VPFELEKKNISQLYIGYLLSVDNVACIIVSPFVGTIINKFGRRIFMFIGLFLAGITFVEFGLITDMKDPTVYLILAFVIRFFEGCAYALIHTIKYSLCSNFYSESKEALIGYLEVVAGLGCILGPLIAGLLHQYDGF